MQLITISADCGHPVAPQNGPLESYTSTTNSSEVFYSCDPVLVPEERMKAVCTWNGWTPNPAGLNCTLATVMHIQPTGYHHVTTATTAIVETSLDSRAQPVATEHAVPSSTQFSTLFFVIGLAGGGMSVIIVTSFILMVVCVVMKRRQTRNIAISSSAAQRDKNKHPDERRCSM